MDPQEGNRRFFQLLVHFIQFSIKASFRSIFLIKPDASLLTLKVHNIT